MHRIRIVVMLACLLLGGLYLLLQVGVSRPAEAHTIEVHKVIAPVDWPGDGRSGIERWHDYGAFALYKVSETALPTAMAVSSQQAFLADEMDQILIDAYPFDTQREQLNFPNGWQMSAVSGSALHLIQFVGPIKADWLAEVKAAGAVPIHYIANNGYLVWTDDNGRAQLQTLTQSRNFLQYSLPYQPYFKLGSSLADRLSVGGDEKELIPVTIQILRHPDQVKTVALVEKMLVETHSKWQTSRGFQHIEGVIRLADLAALAAQPDLFWIGERFERELMDEVQGQILAANFNGGMVGPGGPGYLSWLDSYGFSQNPADYPLVDITDDGIGSGTINSGDLTLYELGESTNPSRLAYIANCTSADNGGSLDGHGHINASIAGGYDARAGLPYQDDEGFQRGLGINPYGRYAGTRIFTSIFDLSNCGNSEIELIKQTQDNGAQISSNSWGCGGCAGTYDITSQTYDIGVRDADLTEPGNQELIFVFAAGNDGLDGSGSIGTPANGKNVITIGASENDRPTWIDGCGIAPNGADDAMDIIRFSSRGPAPGNRNKPELVAPGTHIQGTASTNTSYNGTGVCDQYQPGGQTIFAASSGTSHSTPAVAGATSLYYYWLENNYGLLSPSPAIIKAYLIAHPTYLTGQNANDDLPSNNQGYGMPNMSLAFDNTPRHLVDQSVIFDNSGETWTFTGAIADPGKPLRVALAYTDQEGLVGTNPQVNDLNLSVNVGDQTYWGNHFSGAWSVVGGTADAANNYEAVFLPTAVGNAITITVTAFNIAGDGLPGSGDITDQDFALVCYNCTDRPDFRLEVTPLTQAICAPDNAIFDLSIGQALDYTDLVTLSADAAFTSNFNPNPVNAPGSSQLTIGSTDAVTSGDYDITVWGIAPTSTHSTTVSLSLYDNVPGKIMLLAPTDGITNTSLSPTFTWQETAQAVSYYLEIAEDVSFNTLFYTATLKGAEHTLPVELAPLSTYYWRVRADNSCGPGAYSTSHMLTTAFIVCATPDLAIPDGTTIGVSSELQTTKNIVINDLNVLLNIKHTWVGDLSAVLENVETGRRVTLLDRPGNPETLYGCSADDVDVVLDDEATVRAEDSCAFAGLALSGSLIPNEALSAYDGEAWVGTWRLTVTDNMLLDVGVLDQWCLMPSFKNRLDQNIFLPIVARTN